MSAHREPTAAEVLEWRRDDVFLPEAQATTEEFPPLRKISAGYIFGVARPARTGSAGVRDALDASGVEPSVRCACRTCCGKRPSSGGASSTLGDLPEQMAKIADLGDINITFVPRTRARYFEYALLLHLLPKRVLDLLGTAVVAWRPVALLWPIGRGIDNFLPPHFEARLARAWRRRRGRT